jgi:hypothetical protein
VFEDAKRDEGERRGMRMKMKNKKGKKKERKEGGNMPSLYIFFLLFFCSFW